MSEPTAGEATEFVDLSGVTLERVARLCSAAAQELSPEDAADRPVLRRALRQVQEKASRSGEMFAGHSNGLM